tara:strand:- start:2756 stop:2899 length:144 start_codon:yes stop_codon:yes gene_type:complete
MLYQNFIKPKNALISRLGNRLPTHMLILRLGNSIGEMKNITEGISVN